MTPFTHRQEKLGFAADETLAWFRQMRAALGVHSRDSRHRDIAASVDRDVSRIRIASGIDSRL